MSTSFSKSFSEIYFIFDPHYIEDSVFNLSYLTGEKSYSASKNYKCSLEIYSSVFITTVSLESFLHF